MVTSPTDDGSAGTLRADILAANSGDTIELASTLAGETIELVQGDLFINKNLTIQGLPNKPLIDGEGSSRLLKNSLRSGHLPDALWEDDGVDSTAQDHHFGPDSSSTNFFSPLSRRCVESISSQSRCSTSPTSRT